MDNAGIVHVNLSTHIRIELFLIFWSGRVCRSGAKHHTTEQHRDRFRVPHRERHFLFCLFGLENTLAHKTLTCHPVACNRCKPYKPPVSAGGNGSVLFVVFKAS